MSDLPIITNDEGKKEIEITFSKFICIGASQPHDPVSYTHLTLPTKLTE